jgi:hypothetical protein
LNINTIRAIVTTSVAELKDRHHRIHSAVLQFIAQLAPLLKSSDLPLAPASGQHHSYTQYDIQHIVSNVITDPEPRVKKVLEWMYVEASVSTGHNATY